MKITMKTNISKVGIINQITDPYNFSDEDVIVKDKYFELHDEWSSIKVYPTLDTTLYSDMSNMAIETIIEMSKQLYFKTAMSGFEYTLIFEANYTELIYQGAWNGFDQQTLSPFGWFEYWEGWCTSSIFGNKTISEMQKLRPLLDAIRASGGISSEIREEIEPPFLKNLSELTEDEIMIQTPNGYVSKKSFNPKDYHNPHGRGLFNAYVIEGYSMKKKCGSRIINGKEYFFAGSENYSIQDIIKYVGI